MSSARFNIVMHIAQANTEYRHPFLHPREQVKRVGAIVVTTDKGLCGGLNTNVLRLVLQQHKEWKAKGIEVDYVAHRQPGPGLPAADGRATSWRASCNWATGRTSTRWSAR